MSAITDLSFIITIIPAAPPKPATNITLIRPSFETETDFTNWVRQRAFAAAETIPDASTRQNTLAGIAGQIACGQYDWEWDPSTGLVNWVDQALKGWNGQKQFMFFALKNSSDNNVFRIHRKAWDIFVKYVWDNIDKRTEVFTKLGMFNAPNPQTPPEDKTETPGEQEVV